MADGMGDAPKPSPLKPFNARCMDGGDVEGGKRNLPTVDDATILGLAGPGRLN
jgi:hypothetical protein